MMMWVYKKCSFHVSFWSLCVCIYIFVSFLFNYKNALITIFCFLPIMKRKAESDDHFNVYTELRAYQKYGIYLTFPFFMNSNRFVSPASGLRSSNRMDLNVKDVHLYIHYLEFFCVNFFFVSVKAAPKLLFCSSRLKEKKITVNPIIGLYLLVMSKTAACMAFYPQETPLHVWCLDIGLSIYCWPTCCHPVCPSDSPASHVSVYSECSVFASTLCIIFMPFFYPVRVS